MGKKAKAAAAAAPAAFAYRDEQGVAHEHEVAVGEHLTIVFPVVIDERSDHAHVEGMLRVTVDLERVR